MSKTFYKAYRRVIKNPIRNSANGRAFCARFGFLGRLDKKSCQILGHSYYQSNSAMIGVFCVRCGKMLN